MQSPFFLPKMFYTLKKILGSLAMPLNLVTIAVIVGGVLYWQKRFPKLRKRVGVPCLIFAFVWTAIFGNGWVSRSLVASLESAYPPVPELIAGEQLPPQLANCQYVLVLGGGSAFHPERSSLTRLGTHSLMRLTEGIRILRMLPSETKLIVSGWDGGVGRKEVPTMAHEFERAAISLGVPPERIMRFDETRDTREEIATLKKTVGTARVAVVTTAFHMGRAMALCRESSVNAMPCPTAYSIAEIHTVDFFNWSVWGLSQSGVWFHEWLGRLFA